MPTFIPLKTKCIFKKMIQNNYKKNKSQRQRTRYQTKITKNNYNERKAYMRLIRDNVPRDVFDP